ncbi:expressed hypothetical protein [Trichoplax adhaerens]|uniref:Cathepsin L n=1 Tax=Trichoplax adhaerens TaxID=10228 RepID=B3RS81_TRIAD|nr:expressed hypothetical protein [Trichoplax adhaerens]EDV27009.1 expressed hypothetical protein [Trichoplax adhaerens]|eukprot:XP_002111005.1 expressed hypothetical protein [Trichoplax adhaerens]
MKTLSVFLAICLAVVSAIPLKDPSWEAWKSFHGKKYHNQGEDDFRHYVFLQNIKTIAAHNAKSTFKMAINEFSDLTRKEFVKTYNGYRLSMKKSTNKPSTFMAPLNTNMPTEVDWRKEGYVTPIKNQGRCGSCWAFSTTGSLEGQHFRKTGKLVSLSEQNLIDCSAAEGNDGCGGGFMDDAFEYIKLNNGIDTEASYPYEGRDDICRYKKTNKGAIDTGYMDIKQYSEDDLKAAVATVGPISVAIDASHKSFHMYHTGVYHEPECSQTVLDHGVLVVGYGTENGEDYWLVKNSWGTDWGMNGYIKMSRNRSNNCGIATNASYPLI